MSVVLHIGLPKTGSSFLQEWHLLNRAALAQNSINAVPLMSSHRIAVECLAGIIDPERPDVRHIQDATSLADALAATRIAAQTTLISSEYLHHCEPARLAAFLAAAGLDVSTVLCYVRRQDHLFASAYAQEVKALGVATPIGAPGYTDALNWNLLYRAWQAGFPDANISFRSYEKCRKSGTLLQSFKIALGAEEIVTNDDVAFHNPSLSAEMTEVARILNMHQQTFDPGILLDMQMSASFVRFGLSAVLTQQFETLFLGSNRELAQRHPDDFADYAEADWKPAGEDLTGRLGDDRIRRILAQYDRRSGSQLAAIFKPAAEAATDIPASPRHRQILPRWFRPARDRTDSTRPTRR